MRENDIYVISEGPLGPIKIGRSKSARARLSSLQTGNARTLRIFAAWRMPFDSAVEAERDLLKELSNWAMRGEWLDLDEVFICEYVPDFFKSVGIEAEQIV